MDRDCKMCVHYIGGGCKKWECQMETLKEHEQNIIKNTIIKYREIAEKKFDEVLEEKSYVPSNLIPLIFDEVDKQVIKTWE